MPCHSSPFEMRLLMVRLSFRTWQRLLTEIPRQPLANRLIVESDDLAGHVVGKRAGQPEKELRRFFGRTELASFVVTLKAPLIRELVGGCMAHLGLHVRIDDAGPHGV